MARVWQILLFVYWATLAVATHVPLEVPQLAGGTSDKIVHVAAFALLSGLFAITWQTSAGYLGLPHYRRIFILLAIYAAVDEATQPFVGRYGSWWDWLADVVGIVVGIIFFHWIRERRIRFSIRSLLLLMIIVAGGCYWIMLPTNNAKRFVAAIHAKDYVAAESRFPDEAMGFPGRFREKLGNQPQASIRPITSHNLWNAEREIVVPIGPGDSQFISYSACFSLDRGMWKSSD